MRFTVHRHGTVDEFLGAAGAFLEEREAEHNLMLGICSIIRAAPDRFVDDPPSFATVTDAAGRIVAATVRTPPNNQVLSWVETPEALDLLVESLKDEPLPGVLGPTEPVERFARLWADATGQPARIELAERIFRLERVIPPERPATGSWRFGEPRDYELALRWWRAFLAEAVPGAPPRRDLDEGVARMLASPNAWVYFWENGGEPVSMVGASGETPHGVRIGPVYTPPELRSRGYASALTAAASQDQLDRGRDFVFLFTDLANPTSNKIYQAIGYEPVCDVDMYRFGADAEADT